MEPVGHGTGPPWGPAHVCTEEIEMRLLPLLPVFLYLPPQQLLIPSTMWGDCTPQLSILPSLQVEALMVDLLWTSLTTLVERRPPPP